MTWDRQDFATAFNDFVKAMGAEAQPTTRISPLGEELSTFLAHDLRSIDPIREAFPAHVTVDVDRAVATLNERYDGRMIGVFGANRDHVSCMDDLLLSQYQRFEPGPVSYLRLPAGWGKERRVVALGISLLRIDGVALAVLQQAASARVGRDEYQLEVLCTDPAVADGYLSQLRDLVSAESAFRGEVISLQRNEFDRFGSGAPVAYLPRPEVSADQVILPSGELDRIVSHVVGIGTAAERLSAAGQHLKRGVLLYGPPGTGKTHLIKHLISRSPEVTAVLLSGRSLEHIGTATRLARANQPALIVLEDCDLIAEHRGGDSNAALFETLEAMDGIAGDADVTFVLTTNRVDLLEQALIERPGRVDLAVRIGKPGPVERVQLLRLYGAGLELSDAVVARVAARTEGATASLIKELIRRAVLRAEDGTGLDDQLEAAVADLLDESETLTRTLLVTPDA